MMLRDRCRPRPHAGHAAPRDCRTFKIGFCPHSVMAAPEKTSRPTHSTSEKEQPAVSNFLRQIIERDLAEGTYAERRWAGHPGPLPHTGAARPTRRDPHALSARAERLPAHRPREEHLPELRPGARLRRRLPHALRRHQPGEGRAGIRRRDPRRGALARLRLADAERRQHLYFASDYFDFMYRAAEALIERRPGLRRRAERRGDARHARRLHRRRAATARSASRTPAENLARFREMRDGKLADGAARAAREDRHGVARTSTCATRRSTASSRATHHNTGDKWCIYPMYTYAHPIEDALENITHSSARSSSRTSGRSTTGCSTRLRDGGLLAAAAAAPDTSSRGSTSPT